MSEIKLKPCPFCGGKAEIIQHPNGKTTISCGKGGCMANISWCPSIASAVECWNRRTQSDKGD